MSAATHAIRQSGDAAPLPKVTFQERSRFLRYEVWIAALVVAGGIAVRAVNLDAHPFWCDEAESAINALTILDHGYPSDTYLGLPIFENTLVWQWPEHAEYEFRDVSYSDRHTAVYHGWLPLYAIAASLALHGIHPDHPQSPLAARNDVEEFKRRTIAARLPGVLFGAMFLVLAFIAGKLLYSREAGWAAMLLATFHPWHIQLCRQSRYYSATVTLTLACFLLLWLMVKYGKWRHFAIGAVAFTFLFHTHLLSWLTSMEMLALLTPVLLYRHAGAFRKLATFGGILAGGILPWIAATGFYRHFGRIPRAWPYLSLPHDLLLYPAAGARNVAIAAAFTALVVYALTAHSAAARGLKGPLLRACDPLGHLAVWLAFGYLNFLLLMPAASFTPSRLNLSYWGPAMLFIPIMFAAVIGALAPRATLVLTPVACLLLLVPAGPNRPDVDTRRDWQNLEQVVTELMSEPLRNGTKLYGIPNDHLVLAFYTGLPFQSIAPVRKRFLDQYPGDVIFVDTMAPPEFQVDRRPLSPGLIQESALQLGYTLDADGSRRWSDLLLTRDYRQRTERDVTGVEPRMEELPPFAVPFLTARREFERYQIRTAAQLHPITRGYDVADWPDWMKVIFYRFVDANSRRSTKSNYAERLRGSRATLLTASGRVIYRAPWKAAGAGEGVHYTIVP
jgi:hypothetical protein